MIEVAVVNESDAVSDADVQDMIPALQQQWNQDLRSVWPDIEEAHLTWVPNNQKPADGSWWLVFLNDSDHASELAYHDLTDEGLPIGKVFVRSTLADGSKLSVSASHEMLEMARDPYMTLVYVDESGVQWAGEIADPCESDGYAYRLNGTWGVWLSDFIGPGWFGEEGVIDFKQHITKEFEILPSGYAQKLVGDNWIQEDGKLVFAMGVAGSRHHACVAVTGSRRERRVRGAENHVNSRRWKKA